MSEQHDPGPWEVRPTAGHDRHGQSAVRGPDGRDIAIVYDGKVNGPVLAAAPDLLFQLERYVCLHREDCVEVDGASELLADATAAIAKARGES